MPCSRRNQSPENITHRNSRCPAQKTPAVSDITPISEAWVAGTVLPLIVMLPRSAGGTKARRAMVQAASTTVSDQYRISS